MPFPRAGLPFPDPTITSSESDLFRLVSLNSEPWKDPGELLLGGEGGAFSLVIQTQGFLAAGTTE